jgi:hypothetical protein
LRKIGAFLCSPLPQKNSFIPTKVWKAEHHLLSVPTCPLQ